MVFKRYANNCIYLMATSRKDINEAIAKELLAGGVELLNTIKIGIEYYATLKNISNPVQAGTLVPREIKVKVEVPADPLLQDKLITENNSYTADEGYDGLGTVTVEVPETIREVEVPVEVEKIVEVPAQPVLQNKTIIENGEYSADEGYDGFGNIIVNVPIPNYPYTGCTVTIQVLNNNTVIEMYAVDGAINWGDGVTQEITSDLKTLTTEDQISYAYLSHIYNTGEYTLSFTKDFSLLRNPDYNWGAEIQGNLDTQENYPQMNWGGVKVLAIGGEAVLDLDFGLTNTFTDELLVKEGVTIIKSHAFSYSYDTLKAISLPKSLKIIESLAFYVCGLSQVTLPPYLQVIESTAFGGSGDIQTVIIPENSDITYQAFSASPIQNLIIPEHVSLGLRSFMQTKSIKLLNNNPSLVNYEAFSKDFLQEIHVPYSEDHSVLNAYKTADGWSDYANIIFESDPE